MTSLAERPTWQLLLDAIAELPETFADHDVLDWFSARYPQIKGSTVRLHLHSLCVNVPPEPYLPHPGGQSRVLYRIGHARYQRHDPTASASVERRAGAAVREQSERYEVGEGVAADCEFTLEAHLEDFLATNWENIDFGQPLRIWRDGSVECGRQYRTGVGRIDFLCSDEASGDIVVVELKRGRSSDSAVGQCLRYMGWVQEHLADGQQVRGLIISHESDKQLAYAVKMLPDVEAWTYRVSFELVAAGGRRER